MVPHGDRSNVVIEPFLTDQWYVNAKALAAPAIAAVRDGQHQVRAEELGEDLFRLDGEHPALVHLAPALVGPPDPGLVRAGRQGVRRRDRGRGGGRGARLLRRQRRDHARKRPTTIARDPERARDASSRATRTCSTPGSPRRCGRSRRSAGRTRRRSSKRYYPTNVLVTGFDIIFFWVARMMMMGLHFMKEVPFTRRLHPRAGARRARRQDVEVEGQRHRPARADRRLRRRRAALHAGRDGGAGPRHQAVDRSASRAIATSRPSSGTRRASPR